MYNYTYTCNFPLQPWTWMITKRLTIFDPNSFNQKHEKKISSYFKISPESRSNQTISSQYIVHFISTKFREKTKTIQNSLKSYTDYTWCTHTEMIINLKQQQSSIIIGSNNLIPELNNNISYSIAGSFTIYCFCTSTVRSASYFYHFFFPFYFYFWFYIQHCFV